MSMKQGIIIGIGAFVIIAAVGLWVYLLIFGTPVNTQDMFADLGFGAEEPLPRTFDPAATEPVATIDIGRSALSQLTTRPVVGSVFIANASSTRVRYAERGIGHIYEIDLVTGLEERISGKTFTAINEAVFSPSGEVVALISMSGSERTAYLEVLGDEASTHELPVDAENIGLLSDSEVRYTRAGADGMSGYAYDLATGETNVLFTVPFSDAKVMWTDMETLVYNRHAPFHKGGLYAVEGKTLRRIGSTEYGLSALAHPSREGYVHTYANTGSGILVSAFTEGSVTYPLPFAAIPEKCAFDPVLAHIIWCGAPLADPPRTYQADWYKGLFTSDDILWRIDTRAQTATVEADFTHTAGRMVDVIDLSVDMDGRYVLFTNKIDGTLWLYDASFEATTLTEPVEETVL